MKTYKKLKNMSKEDKENIYKWFIGIMITIMSIILTSIGTMQYKSMEKFEDFFIKNVEVHSELFEKLNEEINYTHSFYKYEVSSNTKNYKVIRLELDDLRLKVSDNIKRIDKINKQLNNL